MVLKNFIKEKDKYPHMSKELILFRNKLAEKFPELRYTSGYREGAKTKSGNLSRHSKGEAWDIENNSEVYNYLWNTKEGISLLKTYGLGVLDETNSKTMKKTGATGKHFHIGKDSTLVPLMQERYKELFSGIRNEDKITTRVAENISTKIPSLATPPISNTVNRENLLQFDKIKAIDQVRVENEKVINETYNFNKINQQKPQQKQDILTGNEQDNFDPYNYITLSEF